MIVAVATIKEGQVEFVVEQVMHGMLETARQELFLQIDSEKARVGIDEFVAGYGAFLNAILSSSIDIPYGSRHDPGMLILFLQLR